MKETQEPKGIRLVTLIFIIALIIATIIGVYMFKEKKNQESKANTNNINTSNENIVENTTNITSTSNSTIKNNQYILSNNTTNNGQTGNVFTKATIEDVFSKYLKQKYLKLANNKKFLESLNLVPSFETENEVFTVGKNSYIKTNIKYADYKDKMLTYVSEELFEEEFTENIAEKDGILYYKDSVSKENIISVKNIEKTETDAYIGNVKITEAENETGTDTEENTEGLKPVNEVKYEFKIKNYNGKCVIDNCKDSV